MDMILIKILAAFLALSQVTTRPDAIKTQFDPVRDSAEVVAIMRDGCSHFRNAFSAEIKSFHGLKFESLILVYRQFCKNEDVKNSPVDIAEVIRFYDAAV